MRIFCDLLLSLDQNPIPRTEFKTPHENKTISLTFYHDPSHSCIWAPDGHKLIYPLKIHRRLKLLQNREFKAQISKPQLFCFSRGRAKEKKEWSSLKPLWCFNHPKKVRQKANTPYMSLDCKLQFAPDVEV